ncbi:hypothetical protein Tco_1002431 [Tanacetum coccineum]|uniref:Uncharacterized protein n=1 Tax=Tanacetum coccineum TaxID=301880 RepID=A0ABQ5F7L8_9ASTR
MILPGTGGYYYQGQLHLVSTEVLRTGVNTYAATQKLIADFEEDIMDPSDAVAVSPDSVSLKSKQHPSDTNVFTLKMEFCDRAKIKQALGSQLASAFLGERNSLCVSTVPITRLGFRRNAIEYKESRIGKQPIEVPSNVVITLEGERSFRRVLVGDAVVLKDPEQLDKYLVRRLVAIYSAIEG